MKNKNPHLQRHILKTETHHELMNSRISPKTRKSLNSKLGGLAKGLKIKSDESANS
jgi:hypothetical protein